MNSVELWMLCGLILLVAVPASGMSWRESLAVGVLVNTKGLVELVILNVGLDPHTISPTLFSMMVIMARATTLMTAPLIYFTMLRYSEGRTGPGAQEGTKL